MKKYIILMALIAIFYSCTDDVVSDIAGQWKLKTIETPDGTKSNVDTVFYSFQQDFFIFTTLLEFDRSTISNGSFSFVSNSKIQITMDTIGNIHEPQTTPEFLLLSGWRGYSEVFDVVYNRNRNMKLIDSEGRIYIFKKH